MTHLIEKVSYLKGLAEGLEISQDTKDGKMIHKIIDVLEDFAYSINDLQEEQDELLNDISNSFCEEIDEEDEFGFIEMECPECKDLIEIDQKVLYDDEFDIVCPNCKNIIISSDEEEL